MRVISRLAPAPQQSSAQYTPVAYSSQTPTFLRNPSTGWSRPVQTWLKNHNFCDISYTSQECSLIPSAWISQNSGHYQIICCCTAGRRASYFVQGQGAASVTIRKKSNLPRNQIYIIRNPVAAVRGFCRVWRRVQIRSVLYTRLLLRRSKAR